MLIPIHIVTGFLGSGKTTFIKRLLSHSQSNNTLVIINEVGQIGIDHLLVETVSENTYLLANGCMCCTVLNDLKDTLLSVAGKRKDGKIPYFENILIETTGLANPASILSTLYNDVHIKGLYQVNGLTTIVDGQLGEMQLEQQPEWITQISAAHQILMSKIDLMEEEKILEFKQKIQKIRPDLIIDNVSNIHTINELFFNQNKDQNQSIMKFFIRQMEDEHKQVQTCVIEYYQPIDWLLFGIWLNFLLKKHGANILRLKGFIRLKDIDKIILLQGVQHCIYPLEHLEDISVNDKDKSYLVFITRGIDVQKIKASFALFMKKFSSS